MASPVFTKALKGFAADGTSAITSTQNPAGTPTVFDILSDGSVAFLDVKGSRRVFAIGNADASALSAFFRKLLEGSVNGVPENYPWPGDASL